MIAIIGNISRANRIDRKRRHYCAIYTPTQRGTRARPPIAPPGMVNTDTETENRVDDSASGAADSDRGEKKGIKRADKDRNAIVFSQEKGASSIVG